MNRFFYFVIGAIFIPAGALAQSAVTVDTSGNITLSGTQPGSTASAPSPLIVNPVSGGNASSGTAGTGSSPSITGGAGGNGTSTAGGGNGGSVSLTAGNGGSSAGSANNAAGGGVSISTGAGGSFGSGTSASGGSVLITTGAGGAGGSGANGNGGDVVISTGTAGGANGRGGALIVNGFNGSGGNVGNPAICTTPTTGICLYWAGSSQNILAWRDVTGGANQVSAGLDDQSMRIASGDPAHLPLPSGGGAIRFAHAGLTGTFDEGGIMSASDGTHTSGGSGTLSLCAGSDCDGTVADPHTGNLHLNNLQSYGTVTFNDGSTAGSGGFTFATALTLPNGSVATTQSAGDNSTKLATTAYVRKEAIMTFGCSISAPITSSGAKNCSWTTPAAVTIIQFDLANVTAPVGCSTYGVVQVWDDTANAEVGSYSITTAASSGAYTAVTGSTNVAISHVLRIKVTTAAAGRSTNAAGIFGTISYQMQN